MKRTIGLGCIVIAISLLVSACGFHLRGVGSVPKPLHTLYVTGDNPYSSFMQKLRTNLQNGGIKVVNNPDQSPYTLQVSNAHTSSTQTSTASSEQLRQYKIKVSAKFILEDAQGNRLVEPFTLSESTKQTMAPGELLQNTPQLQNTKRTLYNQISNRLFDHLSSTNVKHAVEPQSSSKT